MIETLISSKTRVKLLLKFFLNSSTKSYLRNLESEFGESTNAIRLELNKFEEAGMLSSKFEGNKKIYQANTKHPLFNDINSIVLKYTGIDWIVDYLVKKLGDVQKVYLTGSFARGNNGDEIELIIVGNIDVAFMNELCEKIKRKIQKEIKFTVENHQITVDKLIKNSSENYLMLWERLE
ncbi:MAG: nucleotidyltransferase domain-containing protein [Bacteroidota bacterium]|nr:nucleotidyltransferase domain-containing protein [Bacteroidota bacterium]